MIYIVDNNKDFKKKNLANWYQNTEFWLQSKMRHLEDVYDFTGIQIECLISRFENKENLSLIDFGCGEGWILRLLKEKKINLNYIGLDFNRKFIDSLTKKYTSKKNCFFHCVDFETQIPHGLIGKGDIGINFFNFFEIPNIEVAFENVAKMLKSFSYLLVVNVDPIMQILAISTSEKDFINNLKLYERYNIKLGYDKDIDIGDIKSNRIYKSLLYSTDTYVALAKKNNFRLFDYKEVIKTANTVPQTYQYIFFERK